MNYRKCMALIVAQWSFWKNWGWTLCILPELFNMCLKKSCFPYCWNVSSVVLVFNNVEERSTAKNCRPVSLLSLVSKIFEKRVNNKLVDHLKKYGLFSDFQYGFRFSGSIADLLTVVSVRIAWSMNRTGATWAVASDIFKTFDSLAFRSSLQTQVLWNFRSGI